MSFRLRSQRRFRDDQRGAVMVVTAIAMTLVMALAALATDMGHVFLQSRKLQGIADLAALSAAADLPHAQTAALATVQANGWPEAVGPLSTVAQTGHYDVNLGTNTHARFVPAT